jgi:hypothetical protein
MPINDDIEQLLGSLTDTPQDTTQKVSPIDDIPKPSTAEALKPIEQPIPILDAIPNPPSINADVTPVDVQKMFKRMEDVTADVLQCAKDDRSQAELAIVMMKDAIDVAHAANKPASKTYVEGLIKAIEVKAGVNTTVVKIMEANAKLFAALKSGLQLQINNQNGGSTTSQEDLVRLLNTPLDADYEP